MHRLVDILVDYSDEAKFWTVTAQSYARPDDPDDQPQPYADSHSYDKEADAIEWAETNAGYILDGRKARQVTILVNGNEHKTLFLGDVPPFKNFQGQIDCEVSAGELIELWKAGKQSYVIDKLARDHAGLVAVVIVQGAQDGRLTLPDCNSIANLLIDKRREKCQP